MLRTLKLHGAPIAIIHCLLLQQCTLVPQITACILPCMHHFQVQLHLDGLEKVLDEQARLQGAAQATDDASDR